MDKANQISLIVRKSKCHLLYEYTLHANYKRCSRRIAQLEVRFGSDTIRKPSTRPTKGSETFICGLLVGLVTAPWNTPLAKAGQLETICRNSVGWRSTCLSVK
jgi:hypothetical protein